MSNWCCIKFNHGLTYVYIFYELGLTKKFLNLGLKSFVIRINIVSEYNIGATKIATQLFSAKLINSLYLYCDRNQNNFNYKY